MPPTGTRLVRVGLPFALFLSAPLAVYGMTSRLLTLASAPGQRTIAPTLDAVRAVMAAAVLPLLASGSVMASAGRIADDTVQFA